MTELRTLLETRLAELESRASRIDAHRRAMLPADSEEQALSVQGEEVVDSLDEAARQEILAIRAALGRIETGTFGLCEVCEEPIPAGRLRVMPFATRCVEHADED